MFSILTYGFSVAVVGIGIVFCALVILIGLIKAMDKVLAGLSGSNTKKKSVTKSENAPAAPAAAAPVSAPAASSGDELIAVITAAVAAMLEAEGKDTSKGGFVVRSIRRVSISNAPVWNRAGREEQVYSRM